MSRYSLTHLPDQTLLREFKASVFQERGITAMMLAHLGEVDSRRLYAPAGHPSMFEYCVEELHFSEDAAYKRIRVARTARRFPVIFEMIANGRLHLTAVVFLAPYLTPENANELLAAADYKSKAAIEQLLAARFPQPDLPTLVGPIASRPANSQLVPEPVKFSPAEQPAPEPVVPFAPRPKIQPLAPQRYAVQCTVGQGTYEKLQYARALLGHTVPAGELDQVLDRALDALIARLERRKFAAAKRPRSRRRGGSAVARHTPAEVKHAVWRRDGGQCTFVGENGHRCGSRARLEFDHVEPVALGGRATVGNLRLRCRAHNHHEAERRFGRDFMNARRETGEKRPLPEHAAEVIPWLRSLGLRADQARRWAECCVDMAEASLEERVRHALRCSAQPSPRRVA
jgi:5-methylcytosine-specific restriction endonuclease McrA